MSNTKQGKNKPIIERLLENINYLPNGCWEWCGYINNTGSGQISVLGSPESVHRVAYKIFIGPITTAGACIGRTCNNNLCICPEHLVLLDEQTRFWSYVNKGNPEDCWLWTGALRRRGYGVFRANTGMKPAHRQAWEYSYGEIPEGMYVCHKCDTPGCSNPSHLFLGTPKDNTQDMLKKGRCNSPKGEQNGCSKLTEPEVITIRALYKYGDYFTQHKLGDIFGVNRATIGDLLTYKTWKHI